MSSRYRETYDSWQRDPEAFWTQAAEKVSFYEPWEKVLDASAAPFYRWFSGARVNTCYNAVDRHVESGRGDQDALIYDSAMTGKVERWTYAELLERVAELAGAMKERGVAAGDRVVIYLPMVPEAVFSMLACARLGAVHSVVFGGFAPQELATRIDDAQPKLILSASCGLEPSRVRCLQAASRSCVGALGAPAGCLLHPAASGARGRACRGARRRVGGSDPRRDAGRLRTGGRDGPALHSLHLGDDRSPEGRGA